MEDPLDRVEASGSRISEEGAIIAAWDAVDEANPWLHEANPWPLADQIRRILGEDGELDSSFFEEIWTSGRRGGGETRRDRRDRPVTLDYQDSGFAIQDCCFAFQDRGFAELGGVEAVLFSQGHGWSHDCRPYPASVAPGTSYAARWLQEPLDEPRPCRTNEELPGDPAASAETASDHTMFSSMQCQRACELLRVSQHSTEAQIKAAYRRMAGQWHPDRLGQRGEDARAVATQQMAAINEAYGYLRTHLPTACC